MYDERYGKSLDTASDAVDEAQNAVDAATTEDAGNTAEVKRLHQDLETERARRDTTAARFQHERDQGRPPTRFEEEHESMIAGHVATGIYNRAWIVINRETEHRKVGGKPLLPIELETRPGLGLPKSRGSDGC